jgi:hypothetical protein
MTGTGKRMSAPVDLTKSMSLLPNKNRWYCFQCCANPQTILFDTQAMHHQYNWMCKMYTSIRTARRGHLRKAATTATTFQHRFTPTLIPRYITQSTQTTHKPHISQTATAESSHWAYPFLESTGHAQNLSLLFYASFRLSTDCSLELWCFCDSLYMKPVQNPLVGCSTCCQPWL